MKTPDRITLIYSDGVAEYDPVTGDYTEPEESSETVPCLANFISQKKVFESYGSRDDKVLVVRFLQPPKPFVAAVFKDKRFSPIEEADVPIKGAFHLKMEV